MINCAYNRLSYFGTQEKCAENLGLQLAGDHKLNSIRNPKIFLVIAFSFSFFILTTTCYVVKHFKNIDDISETLCLLLGGMLLLVKFILFWYQVPKFRKLKIHIEFLLRKAKGTEHKLWQESNEKSKFLVFSYYCLCWICVIALFTKPALIFFFHYIQNGRIVLNTPIKASYPYDANEPFYFVLTYFITWGTAIFARSAMPIVDGSFCWLVFAVSAHFRILRMKLKLLGENILKEKSKQQIKIEANQIFSYHQKLLELFTEFDAIFRSITLAQILIFALQFCFIIFLWSTEIDILTRIFFIFASLTLIMVMAFYCFGGQKIQSESELLCDDIYLLMPYECMDIPTKKMFLIFLTRSQRPANLTGYFFIANRDLFIKIFNNAFSYAAVVKAIK